MAAKAKAAAVRASSPAPAGGYYTLDTYTAEDSVGFLVVTLRARIARALDLEMHKFDFTAAQWAILRHVAAGEAPTAADLCRQMNYDTGSMARMLSRLERKGVIVREPSNEDRRIVRLRITPAGRKLHSKLRDVVIRVLNHLTAGFAAEEIQHLSASLTRMHRNLAGVYDPES